MYLALLLLGFYVGGFVASLSERQARWTSSLEALDVFASLCWPLLPIGGLLHGGYGWAHEAGGIHKKERLVISREKTMMECVAEQGKVIAAQLEMIRGLQEGIQQQAENIDILSACCEDLEAQLRENGDVDEEEDDEEVDDCDGPYDGDNITWLAESVADDVVAISSTGVDLKGGGHLELKESLLFFDVTGPRTFTARVSDLDPTFSVTFDSRVEWAVVARESDGGRRGIHVRASSRHVAEALLGLKDAGRWSSEEDAMTLLEKTSA